MLEPSDGRSPRFAHAPLRLHQFICYKAFCKEKHFYITKLCDLQLYPEFLKVLSIQKCLFPLKKSSLPV